MARISVLEPHFEMLLEMYRQGKQSPEMLSKLKGMGVEISTRNLKNWFDRRIALIKRRQIEVDSLQLRTNLVETHQVKQGPLLPKTGSNVMPSSVSSVNVGPAVTSLARPDISEKSAISTQTESPVSEKTKDGMLNSDVSPAKKSRFGHLIDK